VAARDEREHQWIAAAVFPKGTQLSAHGPDELAAVAVAHNGRPRKTLESKTPAEALDELLRSGQAGVATII